MLACVIAGCARSDGGATDAAVDAQRGDASDAPLSCEAREQRATAAIVDAVEDASLRCASASDCVLVPTETACHADCGALLSVSDRAAVEAAIAAQDTSTCAGYEDDGCQRLIPPCVPPPPFDCVDQRCSWTDGARDAGPTNDAGRMDASELDDAGPSDAGNTCLSTRIALGSDGGFVFSRLRYALEPCRAFHAEETENDGTLIESCDTEIPAEGAVTVGDLNALLERADVQAAIAGAPILYGVDARGVDGPLIQLDLGGASLDIGVPCDDGSCLEVPDGISALLELLRDLAEQQNASDASCPVP